MTGDLKRQEVFYVGSGAPVTGDEITANTSAYPIGIQYLDSTNGAAYVRTGVGKVTGDWTQIGSSDSGGSGYLVYRANLSEVNGDPPTVVSNGSGANTPLENTIGSVTWGYVSAGKYKTAETFDITKTQVFVGQNNRNNDNPVIYCGVDENDNKVFINTRDFFDYAFEDDILINNPVLILVYP
jgi:hypothetical protein